MRILDRQRYWDFFKAYLICYTSLIGLYLVIDAFSNFDEFTKRAEKMELLRVMGRYYLVHQASYFDLLGSVIAMMAAIFTVTWMQRNNEHLAMLAAGVSTHRVIRPVLVSSVIVSLFSVANQELVIPKYAEELQRSHDDDGSRKVQVPVRRDMNGVWLHGKEADRRSRSILTRFNATLPIDLFGQLHELEGRQATYIPPGDSRSPLKGGWLIRGAKITPPLEDEVLQPDASIVTKVDDLTGYPQPVGDPALLLGDNYFLHSSVSFDTMTRKLGWQEYASLFELIKGLTDPAIDKAEELELLVSIHFRMLRPILTLTLLFMSLPLVLGGFGRNMFVNLGFALGNSAMFYGVTFLCKYFGSNSLLGAALAAWLPLFAFAMLATWRWDRIRT